MDLSEKTQQIIKEAPNWNFKDDCSLLQWMKDISEHLTKRATQTSESLQQLDKCVKETNIALENAANNLNALQQTQFVENRIADDEESLNDKSTIQMATNESKAVVADVLKKFLHNNIEVLHKCHEKYAMTIDDSDDEDIENTCVYHPKNPYHERILPHIYGSKIWHEHWHVGLQDATEDFSGDENSEAYSESSSYSVAAQESQSSKLSEWSSINSLTTDKHTARNDSLASIENIPRPLPPISMQKSKEHTNESIDNNKPITTAIESNQKSFNIFDEDFKSVMTDVVDKVHAKNIAPVPAARKLSITQKIENEQQIKNANLHDEKKKYMQNKPIKKVEITDDDDLFPTKIQSKQIVNLLDESKVNKVQPRTSLINAKNLFSEDNDDDFLNTFISKTTETSATQTKTKLYTDKAKAPNLFDTEPPPLYDDEFNVPQSMTKQKNKPNKLFDESNDEDDDELFKTMKTNKPKSSTNESKILKQKLFDDDLFSENDDLFGNKNTVSNKNIMVSSDVQYENKTVSSFKNIVKNSKNSQAPQNLFNDDNEDLFADLQSKTLNKESVKKVDLRKNLFEDNLSDDNDDLFKEIKSKTTSEGNAKNIPANEIPKKTFLTKTNLFEDDDEDDDNDDLFKIFQTKNSLRGNDKPVNAIEKAKSQPYSERKLFVDDNNDDLFKSLPPIGVSRENKKDTNLNPSSEKLLKENDSDVFAESLIRDNVQKVSSEEKSIPGKSSKKPLFDDDDNNNFFKNLEPETSSIGNVERITSAEKLKAISAERSLFNTDKNDDLFRDIQPKSLFSENPAPKEPTSKSALFKENESDDHIETLPSTQFTKKNVQKDDSLVKLKPKKTSELQLSFEDDSNDLFKALPSKSLSTEIVKTNVSVETPKSRKSSKIPLYDEDDNDDIFKSIERKKSSRENVKAEDSIKKSNSGKSSEKPLFDEDDNDLFKSLESKNSSRENVQKVVTVEKPSLRNTSENPLFGEDDNDDLFKTLHDKNADQVISRQVPKTRLTTEKTLFKDNINEDSNKQNSQKTEKEANATLKHFTEELEKNDDLFAEIHPTTVMKEDIVKDNFKPCTESATKLSLSEESKPFNAFLEDIIEDDDKLYKGIEPKSLMVIEKEPKPQTIVKTTINVEDIIDDNITTLHTSSIESNLKSKDIISDDLSENLNKAEGNVFAESIKTINKNDSMNYTNIFSDEPPEDDDIFGMPNNNTVTKTTEDLTNDFYEQPIVSAIKESTINNDYSGLSLFSDVPPDDDFQDNYKISTLPIPPVQSTKPQNISKLHMPSFKINVQALLPNAGSMTNVRKSIERQQQQKVLQEEKNEEQQIEQESQKIIKSIDSRIDETKTEKLQQTNSTEPDKLLSNVCKNRIRGPIKRRPSTRAARQESYKQTLKAEQTFEDNFEKSQSIFNETLTVKAKEQTLEANFEKSESIFNETLKGKSKEQNIESNIEKSQLIFCETLSTKITEQNTKKEVSKKSSIDTDLKKNEQRLPEKNKFSTSLFDDDDNDDLFFEATTSIHKPKTSLTNTLYKDNKSENLQQKSTKNEKMNVKEFENIFKEQEDFADLIIKEANKNESKIAKHIKSSLFGDDDDDEENLVNDLFGPKKIISQPKNKSNTTEELFKNDSESDDDLFKSSKPYVKITGSKKTTTPTTNAIAKSKNSHTIFGSNSEDLNKEKPNDGFSGAFKRPVNIKKSSLFGDKDIDIDDDEDDLFSSTKTTTKKPLPKTLPTSTPKEKNVKKTTNVTDNPLADLL